MNIMKTQLPAVLLCLCTVAISLPLFAQEPVFEEIDFGFADHIRGQGGSALQMSRHKPTDEEFSTDFFVKHNVELLVTIGGDDTASTANRISKFLKTADELIRLMAATTGIPCRNTPEISFA